jgi:hypothetical protein
VAKRGCRVIWVEKRWFGEIDFGRKLLLSQISALFEGKVKKINLMIKNELGKFFHQNLFHFIFYFCLKHLLFHLKRHGIVSKRYVKANQPVYNKHLVTVVDKWSLFTVHVKSMENGNKKWFSF